jgi:hypothetical protein
MNVGVIVVDELKVGAPLFEGHIVFTIHETKCDHVTSFPLIFSVVVISNGV